MIRKQTLTVLGLVLGLALAVNAQQMRYVPDDQRMERGSPVEPLKHAASVTP